jgi:hypothetical protein
MEVALVASNEAVYDNYREFRREHLDKLTVRELVVTGALVAILVAAAAAAVALS